MRAAVYDRYGGLEVLEVRDVPAPLLRRGEVRVRVRAAGLNPKDVLERKGRYRIFTGSRFPRGVGYDFAGEVLEVGKGAGHLGAGQPVWGMLGGWRARTCAEEVVAPAGEVGRMPTGLSFEEAAAVPLAGLTALQALRDLGRVQAGDRVCVNGASGGVGTFAVQIARALGGRVTSISSARNLELCRGLGAEEALAYDVDRPLERRQEFEVFFDVYGNIGFQRARSTLSTRGTFVSTVPSRRLFWDILRTLLSRQRSRLVYVRPRPGDLEWLRCKVEEGQLRPVVERVFPLASVREAESQLETRRSRGKVVVVVAAGVRPG